MTISLLAPLSACLAMTSPAQFTQEMQEHRQRLKEYARLLKSAFPEMFKHISEQQLNLYFDLHDRPKIESLNQLAPFGYHDHLTIGERLSRFHGENIKLLSPQDAEALKEVIATLNEIEHREKAQFFSRYHLSKSQIAALSILEKVADITDVGLYRTQEMGLQPQPFDGAHYLHTKGDLVAAKLSEFLETQIRSEVGFACRHVFF